MISLSKFSSNYPQLQKPGKNEYCTQISRFFSFYPILYELTLLHSFKDNFPSHVSLYIFDKDLIKSSNFTTWAALAQAT